MRNRRAPEGASPSNAFFQLPVSAREATASWDPAVAAAAATFSAAGSPGRQTSVDIANYLFTRRSGFGIDNSGALQKTDKRVRLLQPARNACNFQVSI